MYFQSSTKGSATEFSFWIILYTIFHLLRNVSPHFHYKVPTSCQWTPLNNNDVAVKCNVQSIIGTGSLATNFSLIQADYTSVLTVHCDPVLFESDLIPGSFSHLQYLKSLRITGCKLRQILQESFRGLTELRNLTIRTFNRDWGAFHLELRPGSFWGLGQVEILDLGFNEIQEFSDEFLCGLNSLKVLNLTNNDLKEVMHYREQNRTRGSCVGGLIELDVSFNKIAEIKRPALEKLSNLRIFTMRESGLQFVEETSFLDFDNLQQLDLSSNKLTGLPTKLFLDCGELRDLYLQNNSISVLPLGQFSYLEQLLVLNLSYNQLSGNYVNAATFASLIRLVVLDLSHNHLHFLSSSAFQAQYSLQMLYLSHNDIVIIADNAFASLYNLHTLDLSYNNIKILDIYTLNGLYVLSWLQLGYNNLYTIHAEAFRNCSSIQDLSLQGNKFNRVTPAMRSLQFLKTLDLSNNTISSLAHSPLRELRYLETLKLDINKIEKIPAGTFHHTASMISLDLSKNRIHDIHHGVFDEMLSIYDLNLSENEMVDINGLFMNLKSLYSLNISHNKISWFDYALIPMELQELDMSSNHIEALGNYYELEGTIQLEFMDVSHNEITKINSFTFPNNITTLNVSYNAVDSIVSYAFLAKTKISELDLSNNNLRNLDINSIRLISPYLANTSVIYISGNPLFCDCNTEWLQTLNIAQEASSLPRIADYNEVVCEITFTRYGEYLPLPRSSPSNFLCQYRSHCFALCHCCDFDACDCEMICPDNCTCYSDQTWNTNIVDCSNREHSSMPPAIPMDVTDLYLDGNNILHLTSHTFIGRKNTRAIYLNNSNIHSIHNRTFNGLLSLNVLHLEHNSLPQLRGFEFESLIHLKELYLSYNRISFIQNATFQNLRSLELLYLDHNLVTEFHVWNLKWNSRLMHVQLGDNPWTCQCDFLKAYHAWLKGAAIVHDAESIQCGPNKSRKFISKFDPSKCSDKSGNFFQTILSEDYMTYVIVVPVVGVILITFVVLLCIYQSEINMWLTRKYGIRLFSKCKRRRTTEKLYDAFISYNQKEEEFVSQSFVPEMEYGTPPYRVCLKYRDIPSCPCLADAISEAIECSHRTIVMLTEQFLQSEWCLYELKHAHREAEYNHMHKIIVVVLENISLQDIDPSTKVCMKDAPVIRWEDKRFWEKLKCTMPQRRGHITLHTRSKKLFRPRLSHLHSLRLM